MRITARSRPAMVLAVAVATAAVGAWAGVEAERIIEGDFASLVYPKHSEHLPSSMHPDASVIFSGMLGCDKIRPLLYEVNESGRRSIGVDCSRCDFLCAAPVEKLLPNQKYELHFWNGARQVVIPIITTRRDDVPEPSSPTLEKIETAPASEGCSREVAFYVRSQNLAVMHFLTLELFDESTKNWRRLMLRKQEGARSGHDIVFRFRRCRTPERFRDQFGQWGGEEFPEGWHTIRFRVDDVLRRRSQGSPVKVFVHPEGP